MTNTMLTNTELEQLIHLINPPGLTEKEDADFITLTRHTVYHISRELLCARKLAKEVGVFLEEVQIEALKLNRYKAYPALKLAYDALCAPQEKTGEVK